MPGTLQALAALLILLPGFLAAYILQALVTRPKQTDLEKVIEALIFSFVIYLTSILLIGTALPISWRATVDAAGNQSWTVNGSWWRLLILLFLPILFGLASAWLMQHDSLLRLFRRLSLTDRTSRASTWNDVLQDVDGVAQVELSDGRSVMGWVSYYSDDPDDASIFLERAAWVTSNGEELEPIPGPGILLTQQAGIRSVMFLNKNSAPADRNG
ncbi:MAG: DUF6338 family protein [Acidobacteriaceae bacterium]